MKVKSNIQTHLPLTSDQLDEVAHLFMVLSESTRLRIIQALQQGPLTVSELVNATGLKQANASKQLGMLHGAGVLDREKIANTARYSIRLPLIIELCALVCDSLRAEAQAKVKLLNERPTPPRRSRRAGPP